MIRFFKPEDEERILESIRQLEARTSGEIRVHLSTKKDGEVLEEARKTFVRLKMHETEQRNGVLFYLVPARRQFAILGDQGINERVGPGFWDDVRNLAQTQFRQGAFAEGVCQAVDRIGEKLSEFFPIQEGDSNELSDEISYD